MSREYGGTKKDWTLISNTWALTYDDVRSPEDFRSSSGDAFADEDFFSETEERSWLPDVDFPKLRADFTSLVFLWKFGSDRLPTLSVDSFEKEPERGRVRSFSVLWLFDGIEGGGMALRSRNDFSRSINFCMVFSSIWNVSWSLDLDWSSPSFLQVAATVFLLLLSEAGFPVSSSLLISRTIGSGLRVFFGRSFGCSNSSGSAVLRRV